MGGGSQSRRRRAGGVGGRGQSGSFDIVVDLDDDDNHHYHDKAKDDDNNNGAFDNQSTRREDDRFGVNFRLLGDEGVDCGVGGDDGRGQGDDGSPDCRGRNSAVSTSTNCVDDYGCKVLTFGRANHLALGVPGFNGLI